MAENPPVSSDIRGIPIEELIGAPVQAAARAEMLLAKATSDFINAVGFNPPVLDKEGKVITPASTRTVNFEFERPVQDPRTGTMVPEIVSAQLPLLAIVPIPALRIDQVHVTFDIEITQTQAVSPHSETAPKTKAAETKAPDLGSEIQVLGKATTPATHIRSTDYASRYHVELHAADSGPSEALSRVIDLMAQAVAASPKLPAGTEQGKLPGSSTAPGGAT